MIDAYCNQPLYLRNATARFDTYAGYGQLPQPIHQVSAVRLNGETLQTSDYSATPSVFRIVNYTSSHRYPQRDIVEIDGIMGYGVLRPLIGYDVSGALLTSPDQAGVLPIGTVLYNAADPVYVISSDGLNMILNRGVITSDLQLWLPPAPVSVASRIIAQNAKLNISAADIDGETSSADEYTPYLDAYRAQGGGTSSYGIATQTGRAFGLGFGRGFG